MSETSNAASFRWDDMRCAAYRTRRNYSRSILMRKQHSELARLQLRRLATVRNGSNCDLGSPATSVR